MEVTSPDPAVVAMDLSKSFGTRSRARAEVVDLAKKPEWYHRRPPGCGADLPPPYRSTYSPLPPAGGAVEPGPEDLRGFMPPRLDLYHDGVHGNLWHAGFYGPDQAGGMAADSSGGEESDSGSDVIFLVSSPKEPLLCGSFLQDGVPLDEGGRCFLLPPPASSPSADTSYSEDSSDSSVDIPLRHARPVVLLSDLSAAYEPPQESSDDSDVIEVAVTEREVRHSPRTRRGAARPPTARGAERRRSLKRRVKKDAVGIYNESGDSDQLMAYALKLTSSDESLPPPATDLLQETTGVSDRSEAESPPRASQPPRTSTHPKSRKRRRETPRKQAKEQSSEVEESDPEPVAPPSPPAPAPPPPRQRRKPCSSSRKRKRKRRRRAPPGPPPLFSPREPELQLKLRSAAAGGRRQRRSASFCPFVHVEHQSDRVVNFLEEGDPARSAPAPSGFVPGSSCCQLGRVGPEGEGAPSAAAAVPPLCCLCGKTANATNLGDLHGPYRPRAGPPEEGAGRSDHPLADGCLVPSESSPSHLEEFWIHEDCSVWSAGVFLVRGRVYGLQEAVRLAQETVCSACEQTGAIMGCFQKGCSRSYHYPCAVLSGCFLNEENFSMRCPDHKNKLFTAARRKHRR